MPEVRCPQRHLRNRSYEQPHGLVHTTGVIFVDDDDHDHYDGDDGDDDDDDDDNVKCCLLCFSE